MDPLTFLSSIIASLAWPAVAIVIVGMLRRPISDLIPLLRKFRYKEIELEFRRRLEEAEEEAAALPQPTDAPKQLPPGRQSPLVEKASALAKVSPRAAVLEVWRDVEEQVFAAAKRRGIARPGSSVPSYRHLLRELRDQGHIDQSAYSLWDDLRGMRNQAAHTPDFSLTEEAAVDYAKLGSRLLSYFDELDTQVHD